MLSRLLAGGVAQQLGATGGGLELNGQGWLQLGELTLALLLSASVGLEREIRQKSAGLRTHTLVGVAAALFMLISKYGFMDEIVPYRIVLDPSRVAAQVVSGIGFIGGGLIFMRRDVVRGLTTAASVWLTAALGMACGAGLIVLALATTAGHFLIMLGFPKLAQRFRKTTRTDTGLRVLYEDGSLAAILLACTQTRFSIDHVRIDQDTRDAIDAVQDNGQGAHDPPLRRATSLTMRVKGKRPVSNLITRLSALDGVREVGTVGDDEDLD